MSVRKSREPSRFSRQTTVPMGTGTIVSLPLGTPTILPLAMPSGLAIDSTIELDMEECVERGVANQVSTAAVSSIALRLGHPWGRYFSRRKLGAAIPATAGTDNSNGLYQSLHRRFCWTAPNWLCVHACYDYEPDQMIDSNSVCINNSYDVD